MATHVYLLFMEGQSFTKGNNVFKPMRSQLIALMTQMSVQGTNKTLSPTFSSNSVSSSDKSFASS